MKICDDVSIIYLLQYKKEKIPISDVPIKLNKAPVIFNRKQITVIVFTELYISLGLVKSCGNTKPTIKSVMPTDKRIIDIKNIIF